MDLNERVAALNAPGRGATEEDCLSMALEHISLIQDKNAIYMGMRKSYEARRDVNSVSGKLAVEYKKLATDENASNADKQKFIRRVAKILDQAEAEAKASQSGDLITEIYRSILECCQIVIGPVKSRYNTPLLRYITMDFVHPLESAILMFENGARVRQIPAVPAPMKTFCTEDIQEDILPIMDSNAKPRLDKLLADGPCDWICSKMACVKGVKSKMQVSI